MNKENLLKEFSELHIGKNPIKLTNEYYKKKHKEMLLLVFAGIGLIVLCAFHELKNGSLRDNKLYRNEMHEGREEVSLQIKDKDGVWREIVLDLYPKEYSKDELEQLYLEASEELEKWIKNENENLQNVVSDLELLQEKEGYPFSIQWESKPQGIIDEAGRLIDENRKKEEIVELTAFFEYEDWKKEKKLDVE